MLVATMPEGTAATILDSGLAVVRPETAGTDRAADQATPMSRFDGGHWLQIDKADRLDLQSDFTLTARIRADGDGTIYCKGPATG